MYAVEVDPDDSGADDSGAVVHVDSIGRAVAIFGLPSFAPPAKKRSIKDGEKDG